MAELARSSPLISGLDRFPEVITMARAKERLGVPVRALLGAVLAVLPQLSNGQVAPPAAAPQAVPDKGTVVAGEFRLRYGVEGTGRPAIVIGSAIYYPRVFSQNLRKHLRLVFLDHRGFAPSPGRVDTTAFALDKLVDDVEQARRELGLGRIAVIGHSGHAFMALEYAKKYPTSVSHVIMIGIGPDLSAASAEATERYWNESVSPERKAALDDNLRRMPDEELAKLAPGERFARRYVRNGPRIWYDPRFDASPFWKGVELNMHMFDHVWGQVFRDIDITEGLSTFDRPVFLALGRYDFIVAPPCSWDRIRLKFRNLTVRVFERSGHTPQYEEAELFDTELLRWIKEHE
jgi:proline iminopeptidase